MKSIASFFDHLADDLSEYIENHQILFWCLGMLLTLIGVVCMFYFNNTSASELLSSEMFVVYILLIPGIAGVGWMWFMVYFILIGLLKLIGFIFAKPLKFLLYAFLSILGLVLLYYLTPIIYPIINFFNFLTGGELLSE